jgi:hypothetical protein
MNMNTDAKRHTSCHWELKPGEIWVGNTDVSERGLVVRDELRHLKTVRLGEQAYDIHGKPIERNYCRPLIIHRSEEDLYNSIMMNS